MLKDNYMKRKESLFINHNIGSFVASNITCQGLQNNLKYHEKRILDLFTLTHWTAWQQESSDFITNTLNKVLIFINNVI